MGALELLFIINKYYTDYLIHFLKEVLNAARQLQSRLPNTVHTTGTERLQTVRHSYLIGLIEEVLNALRETAQQTEGVTQHIQTQHQNVHLLDCLEQTITTQVNPTENLLENSHVVFCPKKQRSLEPFMFGFGRNLCCDDYILSGFGCNQCRDNYILLDLAIKSVRIITYCLDLAVISVEIIA